LKLLDSSRDTGRFGQKNYTLSRGKGPSAARPNISNYMKLKRYLCWQSDWHGPCDVETEKKIQAKGLAEAKKIGVRHDRITQNPH
jgi:hypothetical protein